MSGSKNMYFIKSLVSVVFVSIVSIIIGVGIVNATATGGLRILGQGIFDNASTSVLSIDPNNRQLISSIGSTTLSWANGNVGIGTTAPTKTFQVVGETVLKNTAETPFSKTLDIQNSAGGSIFTVTPGNVQSVSIGNNLGVSGSVGASIFTVGSGWQSITSSAGDASGAILFRTNVSSEKMRITGDGNVGIGTTTPSAKLQVIGNTKLDGNITFTNGAQTNKSYSLNVGAYGDTLTLNLSSYSKIIPTTNTMDYRVYNNHTWNASMYSGGGNLMSLINEYNGYQQYAWGLANNRIIFTPFNSGGVPSRELARFNISSPTQKGLIINASSTQSSNMFEINSLPSIAGGNLLVVTATGTVGIGTTTPTSKLHVSGLVEYADNDSAIAGGLTEGAFYRTGDLLKVVH